MEVLSTSSQVSASADLDGENDNYIRDQISSKQTLPRW